MLFVLLTFTLSVTQAANAAEIYEVFVKQTGDNNKSGTEIVKERKSLKSAYDLLGDDEACEIYVVFDEKVLSVEKITFNKSYGITIEGIHSDGNGNTMVAIDCDVHSNGNLFACLKNVEFTFLAFHFPEILSSGGTFPLIHGYKGELTIKNCQFILT
ncbi:uncharacterized protein MONOS_15634 [Monocercomonoides exilis]|uniref:uncharacterized protein n=1 Tax=Monocercomonoides exilis TaxID=2049356 RepID=UPI00355AAA28|nr:hypothetical protein MONOS_15634 [Monocercomonoides exilis]|eukprot:MONOS_15634.1-p1 / transcript=MONOS_15634.1 / gene=MONOS_15634 / organism=Monocercomonoides_exilis_PA203 / gene_product=unspecified product / transcript_product=unspecified product / location=Mono_scaffold01293:9535-10005(+) / protein_length=157 / sequence_SO=supercontig / SO=protein_coding / is_pseudo=false